jgi:hypothetical protein
VTIAWRSCRGYPRVEPGLPELPDASHCDVATRRNRARRYTARQSWFRKRPFRRPLVAAVAVRRPEFRWHRGSCTPRSASVLRDASRREEGDDVHRTTSPGSKRRSARRHGVRSHGESHSGCGVCCSSGIRSVRRVLTQRVVAGGRENGDLAPAKQSSPHCSRWRRIVLPLAKLRDQSLTSRAPDHGQGGSPALCRD